MYSNQKETGPSDYQWFNSPINSDYQVALLTNLYMKLTERLSALLLTSSLSVWPHSTTHPHHLTPTHLTVVIAG